MNRNHDCLAAVICGLWCVIGAAQAAAPPANTTVEVQAFPLQGQTDKLEPEVLDYRYAPGQYQVCIGLPDDPYKTIVGSDGGLYYDYGQRGPEAYHNGQGTFGTRVLAELTTEGDRGPRRQQLLDHRTPLVITEQQFGAATLRQQAWAGTTDASSLENRTAGRVDFLWLNATGAAGVSPAGQLKLHVGATKTLRLDENRTRLVYAGGDGRTFCGFSRACQPLPETPREETLGRLKIESEFAVSVQRNWARPTTACAPCFRHVLVGFGSPLQFHFPAAPSRAAGAPQAAERPGKYRVALGFIEGWHPVAGKRPLEIRVEGQPPRTLDLIKEYGRNVPVVLQFPAADKNGDGKITIGIHPVKGAEDGNTILSGLWVFPAGQAPADADVLSGSATKAALAVIDADHAPHAPKPLVLTWDLSPPAGQQDFQLLVWLPQGDGARRQVGPYDARAERQKAIDFWRQVDLPYNRMAVPDRAVQALLDSCIRNIYQAREIKGGRPAFQVGPTCYRGTWAADGPFILEAIAYLGRAAEVRSGLEQQVDEDSGPGGVGFSKKSGLRLWMIRRHAQLTGDRQWLERMWPRVQREVQQIIAYRQMTRDNPDQANYGLMPIGFGDGGLGGAHREYTNVYWTLAGLLAAIAMAEERGLPERGAWQAEYDDYWKVFDKARRRDQLTDAAGNTYVPVTMKGEQPQLPQRGAWAFLQSIFPGRVFPTDDPLMRGTLAMLDATEREGLIFGTGWIADGIWNYAASFYAHAHLWLGHGRKAAATLYAFGNHACPLGCWREEQNPVGAQPHYVGDMPHNWGSAEFIRLVRHLLVLERGAELHLFEGLPRAWAKPGDTVRLQEVPTSFGPLSLTLRVAADGRSAAIEIEPPQRERPQKLVVHGEHFGRAIRGIRLGEKELHGAAATAACDGPVKIVLLFE